MRYRSLGKTGLQVSEIGFGTSRLGGVFAPGGGTTEALDILQKALDAGITFFDTADMYSQGECEALLGQAFRGRRDQVIIATKGGYRLPAQRKLIAKIKPLVRPIAKALGIKRENLPAGVTGSLSQDFSPQYITQALEDSLKRMKTECVDLYQLHSPSPEVVGNEEFPETLQTLESLKQQGKLRFYGIAADSADDADSYLQLPGISSVQLPFGLLDLEAHESILSRAEQQGLGIIARGCFGGGLLKDNLSQTELQRLTPKWERILAFRNIADEFRRPIMELAIQFVLDLQAVSVTLLGMRTITHLRDNLGWASAPALTPNEQSEIANTIRQSANKPLV